MSFSFIFKTRSSLGTHIFLTRRTHVTRLETQCMKLVLHLKAIHSIKVNRLHLQQFIIDALHPTKQSSFLHLQQPLVQVFPNILVCPNYTVTTLTNGLQTMRLHFDPNKLINNRPLFILSILHSPYYQTTMLYFLNHPCHPSID